MPVDTNITHAGIKDALRTLNDLDKVTRRAITREYKEIVQPLSDEAKGSVPREAPLSGFDRSWSPAGRGQVLPYQGRTTGRAPRVKGDWQQSKQGRRQMGLWLQWNRDINAYISGKRPQTIGNYTRNLAAFGVKWQGPAAVLFDTSGQSSTPQGAQMIANLNAKYGQPSRVMWRAWQKTSLDVQAEMRELIRKIMRESNRALKENPGR